MPGKAFFVQYRLASKPKFALPSCSSISCHSISIPLYNGIPASKFVVSGDSAGGNIAVALLRYLNSHSNGSIACPAALLLWSSSVDFCGQTDPDTIDLHWIFKTDYITRSTLAWSVGEYILKSMRSDSEYLSPLWHPFCTKTMIGVMVSGVEVLHESIVGFVEKMWDIKDKMVELYGAPYANHDILQMGSLMGWIKEAGGAARAACEFLKREANLAIVDSNVEGFGKGNEVSGYTGYRSTNGHDSIIIEWNIRGDPRVSD